MLLEVKGLSVSYDTAMMLNEVDLGVDAGEMVGVVGPNGAGKTTLLRAISGLVKRDQDRLRGTRHGDVTIRGSVVFDGKRIEGLRPHEIAEMGLIHCPERRRPFREMTVTENLKAGAYLCRGKGEVEENLERVYELFPVLREMGNRISGKLSGGEQQMLAIGRAQMFKPKLLCIDEPSLGLAPKLKRSVFGRIKEIKRSGVTVLLVEQDVGLTFSLTDRNYVLSKGRVIAEGTGQELLKDETIRKTYLGL